ncbi:MAG: hypothetical protein FWE24_02010 [Defluviitaleaceae bacterium]|nr:hypothetical protein [Defluviitaleaceae bacterium]
MVLMDYKCLNCDGALNFDSGIQQMKCPFCDSTFEVEAFKDYCDSVKDETGEASEIEWSGHDDTPWGEGEQESMRLYSCNSCAGEIIAEENTAATSCPYCGNPVVLKGQLSGCVKPDTIIPFKLSKEAAKEALLKHLSDKALLPRCFKTTKTLDEVKGLYVPFWLFDADLNASMRFGATKVRTWSDTRYIYTETNHFNVVRQGDMAYDAVPVDASAKVPNDLMESIEPFDIREATPFRTAFLAGYMADKFDFCADHCKKRADQRIRKSTEVAFTNTVTGYSTVTPKYRGVYLNKSNVTYALLPIWLMNVTWRDKNYMFAMNGQSGKFVGDLPMDWGIFWRRLIAIAAVSAVVLIIMAWLLTGLTQTTVLGSIGISAVLSTSIMMVKRGQLKSVRFNEVACDYIRKGSFNLTNRKDAFLYRNVVRVPKPRSNNRSGR